MNKKILYIVALMLSYFLVLGESTFGASGDQVSTPTLREMQVNIQTLQQEKNLLEFKWNNFRVGPSSLGELIDQKVLDENRTELQDIVEKYNEKKIAGENVLKSIIEANGNQAPQRKVLLLLKRDFYISLKPYISEDKLEEFLSYISTDVTLSEKGKDVQTEIVKLQSDKNERVAEIKTHIEDNNKIIRERIANKITTTVRAKLDLFVSQGNFSQLPNEAKISIFKGVILKLENESIRLSQLENTTSVIEEKIIIFRVMINLLKEYTQAWGDL